MCSSVLTAREKNVAGKWVMLLSVLGVWGLSLPFFMVHQGTTLGNKNKENTEFFHGSPHQPHQQKHSENKERKRREREKCSISTF